MAWTGNFKDQIDDLAGTLASADDAAIQQWILDGCYDVLSKAVLKHGEDEVWKFVAKSGDQTSNDIDIDEIRTIAAVMRDNVFATKGKWQFKAKYADSNSIYAATANDPVWYIDDSKLSIYPAPTGGTPANYYYIPEYAITNWNTGISSINHYPAEYYYHAMLYAAVQVLHRRMVDYTTPATLSSLDITAVVPDEIPSPSITSPGVATIAKPDISGDVPTYSSITVAAGTLGALASQTIADLDITAVPPDAPTIAEINYTPPAAITVDEVGDISVSDVSSADIVAVTNAAISTMTGASSNQPTYIAPVAPDALADSTSVGSIGTVSDASPLGKMEDYITTEEDTELSNAMGGVMSAMSQNYSDQINQYSQKLSTYQAELSDAVNAFNEENNIYNQLVQQASQNANSTNQANLQNMQKDLQINQANNQKLINEAQANQQKSLTVAQANHQEEIQRKLTNANNAQTKAMQDAIQQVQDTIANNSSLISEYQANLAVYQAEVNTEVQEYTQNFQKDLQLWQQTNSLRLQEHSQRMQDELNNFNELNAKYQANVQAELAKHQTDVAEANKEADLTIQAAIQDYTLELQKWQQLLSQYQADVNTQVNEYTNNIQKFNVDLQAKTKGYEWLESQYNKLRSTYEGLFITAPSVAEAE